MNNSEKAVCEKYKHIGEVRFLLAMAFQCDSPTEKKKIEERAMIELDSYIYDNYRIYKV